MVNKKDYKKIQSDLDKLLKKNESQTDSLFSQFLKKIKSILADFFERFSNKDDILDKGEAVKYNRLQKLVKAIQEIISKLTKRQIRFTDEKKKEFFTQSYYRYGYYIEKQVESPLYKIIKKSDVEEMLDNPLDLTSWEDSIKKHQENLQIRMKSILSESISQGKPYTEIAREVTREFGINSNRAKLIVRTECRKAQETANIRTMEECSKAGVITKKMWLSTLDTRTRDSHQHLDGQIRDVDEDFITRKGLKAKAPHLFGVPSEDINCRCTVVAHIEGFEPKVRRARDAEGRGEIIPYVTYEEWFKGLSSRQ